MGDGPRVVVLRRPFVMRPSSTCRGCGVGVGRVWVGCGSGRVWVWRGPWSWAVVVGVWAVGVGMMIPGIERQPGNIAVRLALEE